ncbi:MAG: methylenetetrahydrofolate reductase C-terminal domain-containing protein [Chloroflexota bacterium]
MGEDLDLDFELIDGAYRGRRFVCASDEGLARESLQHLLCSTPTFVRVVELVTSRGPLASAKAARVVALAQDLAQCGAAHAFSITDNVGGYPKIAPEALGLKLLEAGRQVIVHLSCKDLNRNALESRAWTLVSMGFENILAISGDYPVAGYRGRAEPVFDVDSVALLEMLSELGVELRALPDAKGRPPVLPQAQLYPGAAVSPFKYREDDLLPQYLKLGAKLGAGAGFIITQTGYDARKWDELRRFMAARHLEAPVLASVYVLTPGVARHFAKGLVPGIGIADSLLAEAERQGASPDKGKRFFHELAAKQIAIARGLGFRGAYLSGTLKADEYCDIFAQADSFAPEDWRQFARELQYTQPGGFYLFAPDPATGLNEDALDPAYVESLAPGPRRGARAEVDRAYRFNRVVHDNVFAEGTLGFLLGKLLYRATDGHARVTAALHGAEQLAKGPLFDCQDCGDCSLPEIAYLCPQSQCAKNQRNGPCGGSRAGGLCEVWDDKQCIWVRAYNRLKPYGEEQNILSRRAVVKNGNLQGTSAWANHFLRRDHKSEPTK